MLYKLGAGGMGIVLAAYDPELDRKVALKLLRPRAHAGADLMHASIRLHREALALARLNHGNIVAVHDVGIHRDRVFVAMEFVEGRTLGAWLRAETRGWREIVRVFEQAGRGLAHAHEKGLVHRDFKPDNLMIGADGRVRVMDFGIARTDDGDPDDGRTAPNDALVASNGVLAAPLTHTGTLLGTPAYMSPEQLRGEQATAHSDQFSFCVALYEALYGERPFAGDSLAELAAAVAHGRLRAPSRAGSVPGWLRAAVVRGLAAERERRWPAMPALLAALADDPLPGRRRRALGGVTAVLLGFGVYSGFAAMQADGRACAGMADRLIGIWDMDRRAAIERAIVGKNVSYAQDTWERVGSLLDDYTERWVAMRTEACEATRRGEQSGELLDLRMACFDDRLAHVRTTLDQLAAADATVVKQAVSVVLGLPRLERCADKEALTAEVRPPEDPVTALKVAALDQRLVEAEAMERAGKIGDGLVVAEQVALSAETLAYEPLRARALLRRGSLLARDGDFKNAEERLAEAFHAAIASRMTSQAALAAARLVEVVGVRLARFQDGRRWGEHADSLTRAAASDELRGLYFHHAGTLAWQDGKYVEARELLDRALALREKVLGPDHPDTSTTLANLGNLSLATGDRDAARVFHERSLAIKERALGPNHPDVARSLVGLGIATESYAASHRHLERALAVSEAAFGPDHPDVGNALLHLGVLASAEGKLDESRDYYERALANQERSLGRDQASVATILHNLGEITAAIGHYAEARGYHERAFAITEKGLGPEHSKFADSLCYLGNMATLEGKFAEARQYHERALAIMEKATGSEHVVIPLLGLGDVAFAEGKFAEARGYFARALPIWEKSRGPDSRRVADVQVRLGHVATSEGHHDEARAGLERALAVYEGTLAPDHPDIAAALLPLGKALIGEGKPVAAVPLLERALAIRGAREGDPVDLAELRFTLARALWDSPDGQGRDRTRAWELARLARPPLATAGERTARTLDALDAWVRARPG
ncbi:tetratricopeptide repeat protein [Nannocystis exedens]|uniref:tetratricopeptide repeat protein n=1 Tax=Nannocystis exedens TaxID=54 RepID=UPI0014742285|nr:tetratricopeptide repeat protein [Nannocystis exedens]